MEDKIIDTIKDIGNKLNEEYLRRVLNLKEEEYYMNYLLLKYYVKKNLV